MDSKDNLVILIGYANWFKGSSKDHSIWTTKIEKNMVAEWRIYEDTNDNRKKFNIT